MIKILLSLLSTLAWLPSTHALLEYDWKIDDNNHVYVNGNTVHGHKFGFIKDKGGRCDGHLLFITWSAYNPDLEKHEGEYAKILMLFDNHNTHTVAELIAAYKFSDIMTIAMFGNVVMPEEFLNIIKESTKLTIIFPDSNKLSATLDIKKDTFDIKGFAQALQEAQSKCVR